MEINFKKWCSVLLSVAMLFILTSCGDDKASADDASSTESTTITTTLKATTTTTEEIATATTTEAEAKENTQKTTETTKPAEPNPTQVKPVETKPKTTEGKVKPTEAKTTQVKPTEAKPQKTTPKFVFSQSFPVKVTAFSAQYEVISAYTSDGYWYNEDTYLFDINITVKRCDDGINEEKASAVQMKIKDTNGNVVRNTSTSAGMLSIGEQGTGSMAWSVDGPGTYTIEFSSI